MVQVHHKDAASAVDTIVKPLEQDHLLLKDCQSQCNDNAAVTSGEKPGMQQRLTSTNPKAIFVNCDNHSLNLAGVHAASHEVATVTFFGTIEALYLYFSRSTLRWQKLKQTLPVTVKAESETRWSARAEAVRPIHDNVEDLVELLQNIANDECENAATRSEAIQLVHRALTFDFLALLGFWNALLTKIDRVQKRLQDPKMNFHDASQDVRAIQEHFTENRDCICQDSIEKAKELCDHWEIRIH